jgi:hypothetical protein
MDKVRSDIEKYIHPKLYASPIEYRSFNNERGRGFDSRVPYTLGKSGVSGKGVNRLQLQRRVTTVFNQSDYLGIYL